MLVPVRFSKCCSLLIGIALGLTACQDNTQALWHDYAERLSRVTEQSFIAPDYLPKDNRLLNSVGEIQAPSTRMSLPLLNSLGLMHCRLGELIADHNSILGKVAEPSEQFKYQLAFIQAAPACLQSLSLDDQSRRLLTEAKLQKQRELMDWFYWMLLKDRALDKLLFISHDSLSRRSPLAGLTETELALANLVKLKTDIELAQSGRISWHALDATNLDSALTELARSRIIARNMRSQSISLLWLMQLNDWLEPQLALLLCRPGHSKQRQEILQRILVRNFTGPIQQQLSHSRHIQRRLGNMLQSLYQGTPHAERIEYFFAETTGGPKDLLNARLNDELKRHVHWWQKLRDSCNSTPAG
ncbi:DUF3080 family protein [Shewanella indica]|uniref:DUF3080 family protein n=1 Tax=Shewanella indica TaxID=768528 RepID=UPI001CFF34B9|nr:DUF3080 family protein [Shewanella indica]